MKKVMFMICLSASTTLMAGEDECWTTKKALETRRNFLGKASIEPNFRKVPPIKTTSGWTTGSNSDTYILYFHSPDNVQHTVEYTKSLPKEDEWFKFECQGEECKRLKLAGSYYPEENKTREILVLYKPNKWDELGRLMSANFDPFASNFKDKTNVTVKIPLNQWRGYPEFYSQGSKITYKEESERGLKTISGPKRRCNPNTYPPRSSSNISTTDL